MAKYKITEPVRAQTNHAMFGRIAAAFPKGTREARSEQEDVLLKGLVRKGLAELVDESPAPPAKQPSTED